MEPYNVSSKTGKNETPPTIFLPSTTLSPPSFFSIESIQTLRVAYQKETKQK